MPFLVNKTMIFEKYAPHLAFEIKQLFTTVFSQSEGREEGVLVGNLAFELQETTDATDLIGFIARDEKMLTGCVFFTRLRFENHVNAFILSPLAVATAYQKQGIGQALIKMGISHLKKNNVTLLFTYGDPVFYAKTGFEQISESLVKAPLKLTYPEGWLAQSLTGENITPITGLSKCVEALNDQKYW